MEAKTLSEYNQVIEACKEVYVKKTKDYGTAWRILRLPSITDQILIKAKRIRSIQEKGTMRVQEGIKGEFLAIVNYCVMAQIQKQLEDEKEETLELGMERALAFYEEKIAETRRLLEDKNHDYGEAWRDMRVSSMTDIILMKIFRVKQIEDNEGETLISEGVNANCQDMLNYAVFCLIKLDETYENIG